MALGHLLVMVMPTSSAGDARAGQPGQEVMGAAAGIGADQHPPPQPAGQLRERQLGTSMCSLAVLDPAFPGRSMMPSASPAAAAP